MRIDQSIQLSQRAVTLGGWGAQAALALLVCVGVFAVLPMLHGLFRTGSEDEELPVQSSTIVLETHLQRNRPERKMVRRTRTIQARAGGAQAKSYQMNFSPDLSLAQGTGVAVQEADLANVVFEEGQTDQPAVVLRRTEIPYPRKAMEMGIEGAVTLDIVVGRDGRVEQVSVIAMPHPSMRAPVLDAVRRWRFQPAKHKGIAVRMRVRQRIDFRLER